MLVQSAAMDAANAESGNNKAKPKYKGLDQRASFTTLCSIDHCGLSVSQCGKIAGEWACNQV